MKKIVLLSIITILLTGCGAEYTLIYEDDVFKEELSLPKETFDEEEFSDALEFIGREGKEVNYTQEDTKDKKIIKQELGKSFSNTDIIEYCYNHIYVEENDKIISISTDNTSYCNDKNITIKFRTDKEVISNNADKVENNTYIWTNLDRSINLQISKKNKVDNSNRFSKSLLLRIIIVVIVLVVLIPIIIYVNKKNKE